MQLLIFYSFLFCTLEMGERLPATSAEVKVGVPSKHVASLSQAASGERLTTSQTPPVHTYGLFNLANLSIVYV